MKLFVFVIALILLATPVIAGGMVQDIGSLKGETDQVSVDIGAISAATISVVKETGDSNTLYVKNSFTGIAKPIAANIHGDSANALSDSFSVIPDKGIAVFHSWATNLVVGSQPGVNVYIKDISTNDISVLKQGARFPALSPDGKYIVYEWTPNYDTTLPAIYLYDNTQHTERFLAYTSGGNSYGWTTQDFNITNTTVSFLTSYPYPGISGFSKMQYNIPANSLGVI